MAFEVVWTEDAASDLHNLENVIRKRIIKKVGLIVENPFRFLEGLEGFSLFKLRVGDYRAVLDVKRIENKIVVVLVGHRSKVYSELRRRIK